MKKVLLIVVFLMVVSSCTLLPWVKDVNNIMDYLPDIKEGDVFEYDVSVYSISEYYDEYSEEWVVDTIDYSLEYFDTCKEVEISDEKAYYLFEGYFGYVFIKERGIAAFTFDGTYNEDEDVVFLKTPVEIENDWDFVENGDIKLEIKKINEIYEKDELRFEDVIVIEMSYSDFNGEYTCELYYSPSGGIIREYQKSIDNSGTYESKKELVSIERED